MLPFIKNKDDGLGVGTVSGSDYEDRTPDDGLEMLNLVAHDLLSGIQHRDIEVITAALQALCEHIAMKDMGQDEHLG